MLTINKTDSFKVELVKVSGFDGHCLRAYSYFGEEMPDIKLAEPGKPCYKVTLDDGQIIYTQDISQYGR